MRSFWVTRLISDLEERYYFQYFSSLGENLLEEAILRFDQSTDIF